MPFRTHKGHVVDGLEDDARKYTTAIDIVRLCAFFEATSWNTPFSHVKYLTQGGEQKIRAELAKMKNEH
jgi:hypothetical protein